MARPKRNDLTPRHLEHTVMDIRNLRGAPYNPRTIDKKPLDGLTESMKRFGQVQSIVWNKRTRHVVGGHQRLKAMRALGQKTAEVTVVDLSEAEERALNLALNNPEIQGKFTAGAGDVLAQVKLALPDLFGALRLDQVNVPERITVGKTEPDHVPAPASKAVSKRGDVWLLGRNRLVCGDATKGEDLDAALASAKADMVFTDPPYNQAYKSAALGGILNDKIKEAEFIKLMLASAKEMLAALRPGGSYYVCMSAVESATVIHQLRKMGMGARQLVWVKPHPGLGAQDYRPEHEVILYGYKEPRSRRTWRGERKEGDVWALRADVPVAARSEGPGMALEFGSGHETVTVLLDKKCAGRVVSFGGEISDVWHFGREKGGYVHPTQKPVALVERALDNSSRAGNLVLDPFAGSGTTLIACERKGRRFAGLELDPKYCDVIVRRWEEFTGKKAARWRA